ncbi:MAG: hypothetical protein M3548_18025 [Actinomycetota bacterium]|nr:hypothetical protein [Actinomycetota bacterium]
MEESTGSLPERPRWIWITLVTVTTGACTVFLLALGSRGSEIAGVLSLIVAVLTVAPSLAAYLRGRTPSATPKPRRHLVIIAIAAAVGVVVASLYWFVGDQADLNITGDVALSQPSDLGNGSQIELVGRATDDSSSPFAPPRRDHLVVIFTLHNTKSTGFCVGAAKVDFVVAVDGEPPNYAKPVATARSGDEVKLDLSAATKNATVRGVLSIPDEMCRVDLELNRVLLYN